MTAPRTSLELLVALALAPVAGAQTQTYSLPGAQTGDHFGYRVAVVGDLGTGAAKFLVTAPGAGGAGSVSLHEGSSGALVGTWSGAAGDLFGTSIVAIGDVDGDGATDWIVGAPQQGVRGSGFSDPSAGRGYAAVYSGLTQTVLRTHSGEDPGDAFGFSVGAGGDVDGDGVPDYIVGAPVEQAAYVHSGVDGSLVHKSQWFSGEAGYSVTILGDVDGDTRADYAVGAAGAFFGAGDVKAFSGASGASLWTSSNAGTPGSEYGWRLLAPGDFNGDGWPDLLVSDRLWGNSFGALGEGELYWVDGTNGFILGMEQGNIPGLGEAFGTALATIGDVDGDGVQDLAIATPGLYEWDDSAYPAHDLRLFAGDLPPTELGVIPLPAGMPTTFGQGLAAADLDGDGVVELVVGSPREDGAAVEAGRVRVYTLLVDPSVYCTAQTNSQGCLPRMSFTGTPSFAASNLRANASEVLNQKFGLLFWGTGAAVNPFGAGLLCVAPPVTRTGVQWSEGTIGPDDCTGSYAYQFTSSYLGASGLVPGTRVHCQYWARDPAHPSSFNLSDAVYFTVLP